MPASWVRLSPQSLIALTPMKWRKKSGTMLMFTAAKKHLTIFARKREAKGAGKLIVKEIFTRAAAETRGMPFREDRNAKIREILLRELPGHSSELGKFVKKGKSKYAPRDYVYTYTWSPGCKVKPPTNIAHVVLAKK
jgi:hypothetical protein